MSEFGKRSPAVTYFPKSGTYVRGEQENYIQGQPLLARASFTQEESKAGEGKLGETKWNTTLGDSQMLKAAQTLAAIKQQYNTGSLSAADESLGNDPLAPLIQIRLHQKIMGEQQKYFFLDQAFNQISVDTLLYRMPFQDNPAAAQTVGPREQYDVNKINYAEVLFELVKTVTSYDIAWEDLLRSTINPRTPLQANMDWSLAYKREQSAAAALKAGIKNYYNGSNFTSTSKPGQSGKRIEPDKITGGNVHSDEKVANWLMEGTLEFTKISDLMVNTAVAHPRTAWRIAQNTWTEPNTIFNVAAYRNAGGSLPFPGIPNVTLVTSQFIDKDVIYWYNKATNVAVRAVGPTTTKSWYDNTRFRDIHAMAEFYQYKVVADDLRKPLAEGGLNRIFAYKTEVA